MFYNNAYFAKLHLTVPANLSWNANGTGSFVTFLKAATTDTSGHNALSPQFNPGKIATYAIGINNDPQGGWGDYVAETGGSVLPHPYATTASLTTPQVNEGITFLTQYLTGDHVMVPGGPVRAERQRQQPRADVRPGPAWPCGRRATGTPSRSSPA